MFQSIWNKSSEDARNPTSSSGQSTEGQGGAESCVLQAAGEISVVVWEGIVGAAWEKAGEVTQYSFHSGDVPGK